GEHLALGARLELPEALELGLLLRGVRVGGRPTIDRLGDLVGLVTDGAEVPPGRVREVALATVSGVEHPLELLAELADALDGPGLIGDLRQVHLRDAVQPRLDHGELALGQGLRELPEVGLHALDAVAGELAERRRVAAAGLLAGRRCLAVDALERLPGVLVDARAGERVTDPSLQLALEPVERRRS